MQIILSSSEPSGINSVVYDLLTWTRLEDLNLHFRPQFKLGMKLENYDISSNADFTVFTYKMILAEYLTIVEDKKKCIYQDEECQLADEVLLAKYKRFVNRQKNQIVYGILLNAILCDFIK